MTLSFSSTDYIGHQFGPHAQELVDTYIKLDKDIAEILKHINSIVGQENVLIFLTADHGVVSVPNELKARKIPAGYFDASNLTTELNNHLSKRYGNNTWVLKYSNQQFFLNRNLIEEQKLSHQEVQQLAADYLIGVETYSILSRSSTASQRISKQLLLSYSKGFNQKRSGDVVIALNSGWIEWNSPTGTTHGSCFSYDTHVPFFGVKAFNRVFLTNTFLSVI